MSIKLPSKIEHNNSAYPVVDSNEVCGGNIVVKNLEELCGLAGANTYDKLKEFATQVYVIEEQALYLLKNKTPNDDKSFTIEDNWESLYDFKSNVVSVTTHHPVDSYSTLLGLINANSLTPGHTYEFPYKLILKEDETELNTLAQRHNLIVTAISHSEISPNAQMVDSTTKKLVANITYTVDPTSCDYLDSAKDLTCILSDETFITTNGVLCSYADEHIKVVVDTGSNLWCTFFTDSDFLCDINKQPYIIESIAYNHEDKLLYFKINNTNYCIVYELETGKIRDEKEFVVDSSITNPQNGKIYYVNNKLCFFSESGSIWCNKLPTVSNVKYVKGSEPFVLSDTIIFQSEDGIAQLNTENYNVTIFKDDIKDLTHLYAYEDNGEIIVSGYKNGYYYDNIKLESKEGLTYYYKAKDHYLQIVNNTLEIYDYFSDKPLKIKNIVSNTFNDDIKDLKPFKGGFMLIFKDATYRFLLSDQFKNTCGWIKQCIDTNNNVFPFDHINIKNVIHKDCKNVKYIADPKNKPVIFDATIPVENIIIKDCSFNKWIENQNGIFTQYTKEGNDIYAYVYSIKNILKCYKWVNGNWELQDNILNHKADLKNGKVPADQLPSYVDDVLEFDSFNDFPESGEIGKIYVDKTSNDVYRFSGSTYIKISYNEVFDGTKEGLVPIDSDSTKTEKFLTNSGTWKKLTVPNISILTLAEYTELPEKDPNVLYFITA